MLPEQISARKFRPEVSGKETQATRKQTHSRRGGARGAEGSTLSGQLLPVLRIWCLLQEKRGPDVIMGEALFNGAWPPGFLALPRRPSAAARGEGPSQAAPRPRSSHRASHAAPSSQQPPCYPSKGNAKTLLENEGPLYLNNRTLRTASYPGIKIFTGKEKDSPYPPPHTRALPRSQAAGQWAIFRPGPTLIPPPKPQVF